MGDIVSIELVLDDDTESRVREDWERLAAAGLSSARPHRAAANRPHVTLMVRPDIPVDGFARAVSVLPVEVTLGEPILFRHGERGVLARPVSGDDLVHLHDAVHAAVPPGDDAPHTAPGKWTPHVTLARRLRLEDLDRALRLLGPAHAGTGVSLRRWDSRVGEVTPIPRASDQRARLRGG